MSVFMRLINISKLPSLNLMKHVDNKTLENNTPGETLNGHSAAFCCILLHFSGTKWSHILFTNAFTDWQLNCMYFLKRKWGRGQHFPSSFILCWTYENAFQGQWLTLQSTWGVEMLCSWCVVVSSMALLAGVKKESSGAVNPLRFHSNAALYKPAIARHLFCFT